MAPLQDEPHGQPLRVSVRHLCEFAAKSGDLDLRFTPAPTAQQGREGHLLVARRRGADYEAEVVLAGYCQGLQVRGRADGFDATLQQLEEVKTFRGSALAIAPNQQALHWAQLKVYGWLMCESRAFASISLCLVYLDVLDHSEHPQSAEFGAQELRLFFVDLCTRYLAWAEYEAAHRRRRDAALHNLEFPQLPFRPGQHALAAGTYRACVQSRSLLVQAPTGIGKTIGTIFPALRAMPVRAIDKLFFLTAKTTGRQIALDALQRVRQPGRAGTVFPLRVLELVARDKACEHPDKACHGDSCPLASGFYDRLALARAAAAGAVWLDQANLRSVALQHGICPYYLGQEMVRWSDVVVGDYNYYFDRSALLHSLAVDNQWRLCVLVDEVHNLYSRACAMYSSELTHAEALAARAQVPALVRPRLDDWLDQWQLLHDGAQRDAPGVDWAVWDELPQAWLRALQRLNSTLGEWLQNTPGHAHRALLPFYFRTFAFAALADAFAEHSLCEFDTGPGAVVLTQHAPAPAQAALAGLGEPDADQAPGRLTLRNIVPGHFIAQRIKSADSMVLFSATLHPLHYYCNLLGLPPQTQVLDIASPFRAEQLTVTVKPISTRRGQREQSLGELVRSIATQFAARPGNYLAFFSSFDYLELALRALRECHPDIAVWSQARHMDEPARRQFLQQFDARGQGIGFAVLGGVFSEGVDLPGERLIGAFVATLGLPQFDRVNAEICERMEQRFGHGHDYTYVYPGLQKVVQAAGRVIRSATDTGCVLLLDARYRERRYRALLPSWWSVAAP